jgi:hypothetical protein
MSNKIQNAYLQSALNLFTNANRDNPRAAAKRFFDFFNDSAGFTFDNGKIDQSSEKADFCFEFWDELDTIRKERSTEINE